jgi:hypothetical protein
MDSDCGEGWTVSVQAAETSWTTKRCRYGDWNK